MNTPESSGWFILRSLKGATWERFLSIVNACGFLSQREDQAPGILPLLCTCEHPSRGDPSQNVYRLIFPLPQGDLEELCTSDPTREDWSGQLTEHWLVSQCSRMAATLSAIHEIAALKIPGLPRLHFLRSGRLSADMVYRMSSSKSQLGTLVFGNLCQDPPGPYESAPEYFIAPHKPSEPSNQDSERQTSSLPVNPAEGVSHAVFQHTSKFSSAGTLDTLNSAGTMRDLPMSLEAPSPTPRHMTPENTPMDPSIVPADKKDLPARSSRVSASKFHVWCLATIWLRLITWFILGPEMMHSSDPPSIFDRSWEKSPRNAFFEDMDTNPAETSDSNKSYRLRTVVVELIEKLQRHESCTEGIRQLLTLIRERMLVIDVSVRASSQEVKDEMEKIMRKLETVEKTVEEVVAA